MKRKFIVFGFMLSFSMFFTVGIKAQSDAFFYNENGIRSSKSTGFSFKEFSELQDGLDFEQFQEGDASLSNGLLLMTATSLFILINKKRKENKK